MSASRAGCAGFADGLERLEGGAVEPAPVVDEGLRRACPEDVEALLRADLGELAGEELAQVRLHAPQDRGGEALRRRHVAADHPEQLADEPFGRVRHDPMRPPERVTRAISSAVRW